MTEHTHTHVHTHTHTHTPLVVSSNLIPTKASGQPPRLQIPGPGAPAAAGPCPLSSPCASPTCLPWRPSLPLQFSQRHSQPRPRGVGKGHCRDRRRKGLLVLETDTPLSLNLGN